MKSLEEIKQTIFLAKPILESKFKVKAIAIFGSYVRGDMTDESDLDVLVDFKSPVGFFIFIDCEEYLENLLGIKVDLVSRKALKPRIGKYILKEMITI